MTRSESFCSNGDSKLLMTTEIKYARMSTVAILLHAAVVMVHGAAHSKLHIGLSPLGSAFVILVILIGPFCGMALLMLGKRRAGAMLLMITMTGALLFGLWNHFIVAGADHVGHLPVA